jgi:hypothetical protein
MRKLIALKQVVLLSLMGTYDLDAAPFQKKNADFDKKYKVEAFPKTYTSIHLVNFGYIPMSAFIKEGFFPKTVKF